MSKPNILFLLIDGLRADKFYGSNKTSKTPNIELLIKKGSYCNQAISSAPATIASVSSILTATYPFKSVVKEGHVFKINPKTTTYIQHFKEDGYHAYATTPELISYMGLNRIFDDIETYSRSSKLYNGLGQQIIDKLKSKKMKEPWIYYLHLYDLQWITDDTKPDKVNEPKELNDKEFGVNKYERIFSVMDLWIGKIFQEINLDNTLIVLTSDHGHELGDYDADLDNYTQQLRTMKMVEQGSFYKLGHKIVLKFPKILLPLRKKLSQKYVDTRNETIMRRMEPEVGKMENEDLSTYKQRIIRNAIMFTAEGFDERFRVPLLFVGYRIPSGKVISQQVRSIDIFPTIADIAILTVTDRFKHGKSILPLLQGEKYEELPACIDAAVNSPLSSTSNVIGIRTSEYKYFRNRNDESQNVHLYYLKEDPLEENNIASKKLDVIRRMEDHLTELQINKNFDYYELKETNDEETNKVEQELRKLGYI